MATDDTDLVELADGSYAKQVIGLSSGGVAEATLLGAVDETAPATDTASSGLNGRLQRIAQRLTSLIALLPASLGAKAAASSFAVTVATDDILVGRLGEVQASPTANTVLARLKDLLTLIVLAAGEAFIGKVGTPITIVRTTVTRPSDTNAYIANDAVASATSGAAQASAALGRTATGGGVITGLILQNSNTAATHRVEVDIYDAAPAAVVQDNAECTRLAADKSKFLGTITLPGLAKKTANSDQVEAANMDIRIPFVCVGSSSLYYNIRVLDAHTPASGTTYTFTWFVAQN